MKKYLIGLIALVLVVAGAVYWKASPMITAGAAFTAKTMCSGVFISGFEPERIFTEEIAPTSSAFELFSYDIDREAGAATASIKGFGARKAIYRDGLGCTLVKGGAPENVDAASIDGVFSPMPPRALSNSEFDDMSLVLERAFTQPINGGPPQTRAIVVLQDGDLVAERYADGVDAATPLKGWSMNKTLTGLVVGMLVDRGWLDPDAAAPVPEWSEEGDPRQAVSVRDLMTMSSGLDFVEYYADLSSDVVKMLFNARSAASLAAKAPLGHEPGTYWSYSSGTTNILARIAGDILEAHGTSLPVFLQEELFGPLGVHTAVMELDSSGDFIGSSFGYMAAQDWARMGRLFLDKGKTPDGRQIVSEDWIAFMTADNGISNGEYGAQLWLNKVGPGHASYMEGVPDDAYMFLGHDGQFVAVLPSASLVVVRLGETPSWSLAAGAGPLLSSVVEAMNG